MHTDAFNSSNHPADRRVKRHRALIVAMAVCCGLGVWLSGELLIQHEGDFWNTPATSAGLLASLCGSVSSLGFDCTDAAAGAWSEIHVPLIVPGGDLLLHKKTVTVPVAFISLAYFIFMGAWTVFVGWARPYERKWHRLPLTIAGIGGLASLFFVGLMAFGYAAWCLQCLAVHVVNIVLVALTCRLNATPRAMTRACRFQPLVYRNVRLREVVCVVSFSMILIAGAWMYRAEHLAFRGQYRKLAPYRSFVERLQRNPDFLTREYLTQPLHAALVNDELADDSTPRLVVFTDFQCKSCYCNWHQINTAITDAFKGRLKVVLKHYPLCADCNADASENIHPNACTAAYASEAARMQGGDDAARRMHDLLFKRQNQLDVVDYRNLAAQLGLDEARFIDDMNGPTVRQIVAYDVALARELGVRGTPTMFFNGREVPNLCRTPVFWQAMAARSNNVSDIAEDTPADSEVPAVTLQRGATP